MHRNLKTFPIVFVFACILRAQPHPLAERVLILVNDSMPSEAGTGKTGASVFVGEYYAEKRGIPKANILHVKTSTEESISYDDYKSEIEKPLKKFLEANRGAMKRQILYIVPVYGIPLKVSIPPEVPALDSVLAGMYASPNFIVRIANPYAGPTGGRPPKFSAWSAQRDASGFWKMFIVSRLDGPGAMVAKGLVDKAISAENNLTTAAGKAYFDYQGTRTPADGGYYIVDEDIRKASVLSESKGFSTTRNTQAQSLCGAAIHPASVYSYDAVAKNVYVNAYGADAATSFSVKQLPEGDVTVRLKNETVNNTGNILFITLASADPRTYIKLTYPFVPFTGWSKTEKITLEKFVDGASAAKAEATVDSSMETPINSVTELKISFANSAISLSRDGTVLAQAPDAGGGPVGVTKISIGARCWNYRLNGLIVTAKSGAVLWNDTFSSDTTGNYTWDMVPSAGPNALWAWGWYTGAYDTYRFVNGAVGAQLTSYTAGTIRKPIDPSPASATLGLRRWNWNWVPRMLEQGVTATWGAVYEPYAEYYALGGNVFDHFWSGYNFGESFYIAQNTLNWVMTAVGDPLYAPKIFQNPALATKALDAVANAATLQSGPIAPGEIVTLFGDGLGPDALTFAKLTPADLLDTEIEGTRVLFDDVAAPLIYASSKQVSAVVPYETGLRSSTQIIVEANGARSNPLELRVVSAAPGIFTQDSSGGGLGAVLNEGTSLNSENTPAPRGSIVVIYATGDGQTDPAGVNGRIMSGVTSRPALPVSVQVGGVDAAVLYAGSAPGQVAGLLQVNLRVPDTAPSGLSSLVLTIGGAASQEGVLLAIR